MTPLRWALEHDDLIVGWVCAEGVRVEDSDDVLSAELAELVADPGAHGLDDVTRTGIRDLLRGRGYKPAGRGKPASEFLARAAERDAFPVINNVVDINNLVSLETGWPISVFDLDVASPDGQPLELRFGNAGEQFVFNPSGQSIDVGGLVVVARPGGEPLGNPVKDSMATKITAGTSRALAVIYGSRALSTPAAMEAAAQRFGELLRVHAGAEPVAAGVLESAARPDAIAPGS